MSIAIDTSKLQHFKAFHKVHDQLITCGFPQPEYFALAKKAGVEVVINVISPLSPEEQPNIAAIYNAGLIYFSIPYDIANPIVSLEAFIATMNQLQDKNVLVFCSHNWRASFMLDAYYQITTHTINENALNPHIDVAGIIEEYPIPSQYVLDVEKHYNIKINR